MSSTSLIITADDFGLCPEVDEGICDLVEAKVITAVAVFTNRPYDYDPQSLEMAGVGVGLHLNLSLGRPLTPAVQIRSLIDSSGQFHTDLNLFVETFDPAHARKEMLAQLERFRTIMSFEPAFLNFHKHLADQDKRLFELMLDMAEVSGNCPVRVRTDAARGRCRERGIPTCDHFAGDVCSAGYWTEPLLSEVLTTLRSGVTELMCHPARPMPSRPGISYDWQRDLERQALLLESTGKLLAGIRRGGFEMITN